MSLTNGYPNYDGFGTSSAASAYDCCVLCLQTSGCGAAAYDPAAGICDTVYNSGTCSPTELDIDIATGGQNEPSYTFSNSNCGQAYYDGEFTSG